MDSSHRSISEKIRNGFELRKKHGLVSSSLLSATHSSAARLTAENEYATHLCRPRGRISSLDHDNTSTQAHAIASSRHLYSFDTHACALKDRTAGALTGREKTRKNLVVPAPPYYFFIFFDFTTVTTGWSSVPPQQHDDHSRHVHPRPRHQHRRAPHHRRVADHHCR